MADKAISVITVYMTVTHNALRTYVYIIITLLIALYYNDVSVYVVPRHVLLSLL